MNVSLHTRIRARLHDSANSLLLEDFEQAWTGLEIETKILDLTLVIESHTLRGEGVAIAYPNNASKALLVLATIYAARVPILVSSADFQSLPGQWIDRTGVRLVFANAMPSALSESSSSISPSATIVIVGSNGTVRSSVNLGCPPLPKAHLPDGAVLVLFTSGSTGKAKGVVLGEKGLRTVVDHMIGRFALNDSTVSPVIMPLCHSMALNTHFLPTFFAGGRSLLLRTDMSLHKVYRMILERKGTFVSLISSLLPILRHERRRHGLDPAESVRVVQLAGGSISNQDLELAIELFPNSVLHKGYGLTESPRVAMISSRDPNFWSASTGPALPFAEIETRDSNGRVLGAGEPGEIFVKSDAQLIGHLDGSAPAVDVRGFLPTGDAGVLNSCGEICVLGRSDELIKVNGNLVSSAEIENKALSVSDAFVAAKCICVDDSSRSDRKLVLFVELPEPEHLPMENLATVQLRLWEQFQGLRLRPREVFLVPRIPRTKNGKISIPDLKALGAQRHTMRNLANPHSRTAYFMLASDPTSKGNES